MDNIQELGQVNITILSNFFARLSQLDENFADRIYRPMLMYHFLRIA